MEGKGQGPLGPAFFPQSIPSCLEPEADPSIPECTGPPKSHCALDLCLSHCLSPTALAFFVPVSSKSASITLSPNAHEPSCI